MSKISVNELLVSAAENVPVGTLVLCAAGGDWTLALRVETPGEDAGERVGLLLMHTEIPHLESFGMVPQADQSGTTCIALGVPLFRAEARAMAMGGPPLEPKHSGRLRVGRQGLTIESHGFRFGTKAWWNVASGILDRSDSPAFDIARWELGMRQSDGAVSMLLRYPEDYAPATDEKERGR
jgi:hypothetical protein